MTTRLTDEQKAQVRYWIHIIGCDIIACYADAKDKFKEYWSNNLLHDVDYDARLEKGDYDDGIAIICGKLRHGQYKGKFISTLDFDTLDAFLKFSTNDFDNKKLSGVTRVEWHRNLARIHVFFITDRPFKNYTKLVIIDSIISLHRAEFAGRGTLADRQQRLNGMLRKLVRLAEIFNIAIVISNQVQSSPDTFFGDPTKAAGGNILAHSSTYRVYLRKSGETRVARMMDSPYHPYSDTRFTLNEKGTDDIEEGTLKKSKSNSKKPMDGEED